MKELRCSGWYRGKACKKLLGKADAEGTVAIKCPRCTKENKFTIEK